jgi:hypothetical protein
MTQSAGSSISVNVFVCSPKTMLSAACSPSQRQGDVFLGIAGMFLLYFLDSGSLSGQ